MPDERGGRPRDAQLDQAILKATRELLAVDSYAQLSMESVAARAQVGKKTLYRRWPSKAPLVADAVLDAYGRGGSFGVPDTTDIRADLRSWLIEHAEFIADPQNAALIRALIAAAASNPSDNERSLRTTQCPTARRADDTSAPRYRERGTSPRRRPRRNRQRAHRHLAVGSLNPHSDKRCTRNAIRRTAGRDPDRRVRHRLLRASWPGIAWAWRLFMMFSWDVGWVLIGRYNRFTAEYGWIEYGGLPVAAYRVR